MSMTVNAVPKSQAVKLKSKIPIAVLVQPLAPVEYEPRSINFGVSGVIRCRACRAYINPFVDFKENKGVWVCNLCGRQNELPSTYIQEIRNPETRANHPELTDASFEIVAPPEYTVRAPQPPTFIFVIDVSHRAVASGMVNTVCQSIAASLIDLPGKPRTNIAFITFDSTVHVYCLKSTNKLPQVYVLPNVDDVYLPVPSDLLVNMEESKHLVDHLLDCIPRMYGENKDPENAFGPALNVAMQIGHRIGGKIMCFTAGIPNQGEGTLQNRDNPRLYGTDKEHTLLQAATKHYRTKAESMTQYHLMCDVLAFPDTFMDIATLGELAQYSGGQLLYYPGFSELRDAERVSYDVYRILTREQSWEAVFRVRASRGLKISEYYGNFFKRSQDLLAVPNSDADKAYVVEFVNEENPIPTSTAAVQSALLYSNSNGERRLRIHTLIVPVASDAPELFNAINVQTMTNYTAKKGMFLMCCISRS
jgi:protein transport protein SEC24